MTGQPCRLPEGGRIDRDRPLAFTFNGRGYEGYAGDTLASALLAGGIHLVGRSFKYHRPRGILSAGAEEPVVVQLERGPATEPNLRPTQIELYDGLVASSVNCWPGVETDLGAVASLFGRFLPAGFYYKTFMWPRPFWKRLYERAIRRAAGLGTAPAAPDPDRYERMNAHCDVVVVGGGPAGLAAALAAGRSGARVILANSGAEPGGGLLRAERSIDGAPAQDWIDAAAKELAGLAEARVLARTTVTGYDDHNFLIAVESVTDHLGPTAAEPHLPRLRLWRIRAKQVVLATGAIERGIAFAGNDRPGIMLAGAVQSYLTRYAVKPGDEAVVFTNNDGAYATAVALAEHGIPTTAVDPRREPGEFSERARAAGVEMLTGHVVTAAEGSRRVAAVEIAPLDAIGAGVTGEARRIDCDLVAVSGGWNPAVHLFSQSQGRLAYDAGLAAFVPATPVQATRCVGACTGAFTLSAALAQGFAAGAAAASDADFAAKAPPPPAADDTPAAAPLMPLWSVPADDAIERKHFVDLQSDVTVADVRLAAREGYRSVEHLKRYTTLGMGTDQGKTGNVTGLALLAGELGQPIEAVGTTTFRPPYTPLAFGAIAGRDVGPQIDPVRRTPMHEWHAERGAVFENVGLWQRPYCYPRPGESKDDAVNRECLAARNTIGIVDVSTLGKIDLQGPDAATLLDRLYINGFSTLAVGRGRYGVMLDEAGMVLDDGVTARLGAHRFHMTTTTGNAARVLGWIENWLQTEWPELEVYATSVTEQYAVAGICGPRARALLAELTQDIDLAPAAFPFMTWRNGAVAGIPARVFRISFSGELSYEINVPASYGMALWTALMTAGARHGITPYGTRALHVLRAEKGYFIVGHETDGSTTPDDLGLGHMVSGKKDFIGKRSLARPEARRPDRKQLVGLRPEDPRAVLPEGAQIVDDPNAPLPMPMVGHVTASYWSANLGHAFALALVKRGRDRIGQQVHVPLERRTIAATIVEPVFYDPGGERLHG